MPIGANQTRFIRALKTADRGRLLQDNWARDGLKR